MEHITNFLNNLASNSPVTISQCKKCPKDHTIIYCIENMPLITQDQQGLEQALHISLLAHEVSPTYALYIQGKALHKAYTCKCQNKRPLHDIAMMMLENLNTIQAYAFTQLFVCIVEVCSYVLDSHYVEDAPVLTLDAIRYMSNISDKIMQFVSNIEQSTKFTIILHFLLLNVEDARLLQIKRCLMSSITNNDLLSKPNNSILMRSLIDKIKNHESSIELSQSQNTEHDSFKVKDDSISIVLNCSHQSNLPTTTTSQNQNIQQPKEEIKQNERSPKKDRGSKPTDSIIPNESIQIELQSQTQNIVKNQENNDVPLSLLIDSHNSSSVDIPEKVSDILIAKTNAEFIFKLQSYNFTEEEFKLFVPTLKTKLNANQYGAQEVMQINEVFKKYSFSNKKIKSIWNRKMLNEEKGVNYSNLHENPYEESKVVQMTNAQIAKSFNEEEQNQNDYIGNVNYSKEETKNDKVWNVNNLQKKEITLQYDTNQDDSTFNVLIDELNNIKSREVSQSLNFNYEPSTRDDEAFVKHIKTKYDQYFKLYSADYKKVTNIIQLIEKCLMQSTDLPKNKKLYHLITSTHNFFVGIGQNIEVMLRVSIQYNRMYILNIIKKEIENMPQRPVVHITREGTKPYATVKFDTSPMSIDIYVNDLERLYTGYYIKKYLTLDKENTVRLFYYVLIWANQKSIINRKECKLSTQAMLMMIIIFLQRKYKFPYFTIDTDFISNDTCVPIYTDKHIKQESNDIIRPKYNPKVEMTQYDLIFLREEQTIKSPSHATLVTEFFIFWVNHYSVYDDIGV